MPFARSVAADAAGNFFKACLPYSILRIINSDSLGLPSRAIKIRFLAGRPSSALPDTDGRHDRTGHGTWVLLAVFVAHDCRPWLSVAGTPARASVRATGMDPRACDGWTTVCPLWLLGGSAISRAGFHNHFSNG